MTTSKLRRCPPPLEIGARAGGADPHPWRRGADLARRLDRCRVRGVRVYLLASGVAQGIAAFTVGMSLGSRALFFITGALSVVLGYFAFRDFNNGAAVWLLATWIGVGFIFQGVTATVLAIDVPELPARGWYIFVGILTVIAGLVTIVCADQLDRGARDLRRVMAVVVGIQKLCRR